MRDRDAITWDITSASQALIHQEAWVRSRRQASQQGTPTWDAGSLTIIITAGRYTIPSNIFHPQLVEFGCQTHTKQEDLLHVLILISLIKKKMACYLTRSYAALFSGRFPLGYNPSALSMQHYGAEWSLFSKKGPELVMSLFRLNQYKLLTRLQGNRLSFSALSEAWEDIILVAMLLTPSCYPTTPETEALLAEAKTYKGNPIYIISIWSQPVPLLSIVNCHALTLIPCYSTQHQHSRLLLQLKCCWLSLTFPISHQFPLSALLTSVHPPCLSSHCILPKSFPCAIS